MRPSLPSSSHPAPSSLSLWDSEYAAVQQRTDAVANANSFAVDMQMRMVAELEDAYWQAQFSKETYYAAGRGYDQYRPAYEMGWSAALAYPDAQFGDIAQHLELQWHARKATSLLPWREVQPAVKKAWMHAGQQMHSIQTQIPEATKHSPEVVQVLDSLHRSCVLLVDDLRRMSHVVVDDFAQQVLGRHIKLLRRMALQIKKLTHQQDRKKHPLVPLQESLYAQWRRLKSSLGQWDAAQVFEVCELRERSLLGTYQAVLRKPLPGAVKDLLEQHAKLLRHNMEKLSWVRQNWSF